ncbi:DUF2914 domain-containing protein [Limisalsivibrio acetivorans]|uniref:DUF2914 domain-containing protein n=1 Tax=Limisalsivibrio acetivorans TaxID=1304888 RepID=UPI0003B55BD9|nr:DUF2914 domain-containing protein [Limisalsivibrio acetivorans]
MRKLILSLIVFALATTFAFAETKVSRISIAKDIENREPAKTGTEFNAGYHKLYCFTEIETDEYPTEVTHIWIYKKNIEAEVKLNVDSPKWRTYSSKLILPEWVGEWKVEVYSKSGKLIDSIDFTINEQ